MGLPSVYEPDKYETDIYALWENSGVFKADPNSGKPHFSIAMPPPNETGTLHIGSATFVTLQDILARHARQQGKDVLWLPGTDHAALATDNLVEQILAEQGISKKDIGREKFITEVEQFVGDNRDRILAQFRAMGASCDWSRTRYTLDDALNRAVNETFVKMYNDGLIYRGHRIVNWDPKLETTISDDEVDHTEEQGAFYTLQYGPFQIGTARPETKFGDKYVVMHPDDKRYAQYQSGEQFEAEWINGPVTATIIKDEAVDPKFGTGVMTITPWHDKNDFDIAERHGLEREQIIDFEGKLLPIAGEFAGMDIKQARPKIVEKLESKNLLVKVDEKYTHNIARNSRGKGVIEPQIMLQWFVDVNRPAMEWKGQKRSFKEVMRAVVEDSDIEIIPKRFEKTYYRWIDNLYDWCISRQIWWGHQIPAWYKDGGKEVYVGIKPPAGAGPVESALPARDSGHSTGQGWTRDPDTLDTWFSSALWTWSTLIDTELAKDADMPLEQILEQSIDFKTYHPTTIMETGWDILFFWVVRMILATTYMTGEVPFKTVYLHGLVRTEDGKKMSKSDPDSIIDPLEIIEQYGTDALRLALVSGVNAGQDSRLGRGKIVDNRNFCNKLWNIARYIESMGASSKDVDYSPITPADHWILDKSSILTEAITKNLANYEFSEAYQNLYHFIWDDLADWYVEASKVDPNPALARAVLGNTLILAHPFAPFITEAIWQQMGGDETNLLATQLSPKPMAFDKAEAAKFEGLMWLIRDVRALNSMTGSSAENLFYENVVWVGEQKAVIEKLARLKVTAVSGKPNNSLPITAVEGNLWIDIDPSEAKPRVQANLDEIKHSAELLRKRLDQPGYRDKAPEELVKESEKELEANEISVSILEKLLKSLED